MAGWGTLGKNRIEISDKLQRGTKSKILSILRTSFIIFQILIMTKSENLYPFLLSVRGKMRFALNFRSFLHANRMSMECSNPVISLHASSILMWTVIFVQRHLPCWIF